MSLAPPCWRRGTATKKKDGRRLVSPSEVVLSFGPLRCARPFSVSFVQSVQTSTDPFLRCLSWTVSVWTKARKYQLILLCASKGVTFVVLDTCTGLSVAYPHTSDRDVVCPSVVCPSVVFHRLYVPKTSGPGGVQYTAGALRVDSPDKTQRRRGRSACVPRRIGDPTLTEVCTLCTGSAPSTATAGRRPTHPRSRRTSSLPGTLHLECPSTGVSVFPSPVVSGRTEDRRVAVEASV